MAGDPIHGMQWAVTDSKYFEVHFEQYAPSCPSRQLSPRQNSERRQVSSVSEFVFTRQ